MPSTALTCPPCRRPLLPCESLRHRLGQFSNVVLVLEREMTLRGIRQPSAHGADFSLRIGAVRTPPDWRASSTLPLHEIATGTVSPTWCLSSCHLPWMTALRFLYNSLKPTKPPLWAQPAMTLPSSCVLRRPAGSRRPDPGSEHPCARDGSCHVWPCPTCSATPGRVISARCRCLS